jgi:small subunit ribosomal protein S20
MANHKSAIKRIRQAEKRNLYNRSYRSRARTLVKKARATVASGNATDATEAVRQAIQDLDKAVSKGVLHANNAARRKSRLMKRLNAIQTTTTKR